MHVFVMNHFRDKPKEAELVQRFLTVAEAQVKTKYPHSAKVYLAMAYPRFDLHTL